MRRSRPLPIETTAAICFVVVASLVALTVLVRHADDREVLDAADRSPLTTTVEGPSDPGNATTTTAVGASTTTEPGAPATTTSTTSTTTTTTVPPAAPPATQEPTVERPPECDGLVSETYWSSTGEPSELVTAAGSSARYVEAVTNTSDEPCTLETNRCGSTAEVRTDSGERTDAPSRHCTSDSREVVLDPGAQRTEHLTARFPVPPGEYRVHIRRYDGTAVDLPVRLDDRLAACAADPLVLEVSGNEPLRQRSEIRDSGFDIELIVTGAAESCTVRTVETRLRLVSDRDRIDIEDGTERWLTDPGRSDDRIYTHMVVPPTDVPPGQYTGRVTVVLESGEQLTAAFDLLVA